MEEKVFFEYEDVKVTNARFINGHETYAMGNVTSVKAFEQKPNRIPGIIGVLIGFAIAGSSSAAGGLIVVKPGEWRT